MNRVILSALFAATLLFPASSLAGGRAAASAVPRPLVTEGHAWVFDVMAQQPDGTRESWVERWTVNTVEAVPGTGAKRIYIDVEKPEGGGELPETTIELILMGSALWDVYTLDRLRPPATLDVARILAQRDPLVDFARVSATASVTRRGEDPRKFVRFVSTPEVTVRPGVTLKGVVEATRSRGETDSTETWWFDGKRGIAGIRSQLPVAGGGTVFTWVLR